VPLASYASSSISASYASSSLSASYALSASAALSSSYALSASAALSSSYALSASAALSASYALSASAALSSSYALSASYAPVRNNPVIAFGTFFVSGSMVAGTPLVPFSGSYNMGTGSYLGNGIQTVTTQNNCMETSSAQYKILPGTITYGNLHMFRINMLTPSPSRNYTVIGTSGGEQGVEWFNGVNFPVSKRTTTAFTMSMIGNADWSDRGIEFNWISIMVLHP
jgi:hypothetical protein